MTLPSVQFEEHEGRISTTFRHEELVSYVRLNILLWQNETESKVLALCRYRMMRFFFNVEDAVFSVVILFCSFKLT